MKVKTYPEELVELAKFFKALSHPVRVHILKELSKMNSCCYSSDIAKDLEISPSTLSQHLKELKYVGLIQGEIEAPYIKYCINRENWNKAKNIMSDFFKEFNEIKCNVNK